MGDSEDFCGSPGALPLKLHPERWLWCLHCERFFQAKDLRSDFTGGKQGCAFDGCDGAGWKMDIFDWDDWNQDDDLAHWPKPEDELAKGQFCPLYPEKEPEKPVNTRQELGDTGMTREEAIRHLERRFPIRQMYSKTNLGKPVPARPMRNGRPIGRNSECFCGSGKKYKRCCESGSQKK